jgi:hypothetical protein
LSAPEREVTSPSDFKVVVALSSVKYAAMGKNQKSYKEPRMGIQLYFTWSSVVISRFNIVSINS